MVLFGALNPSVVLDICVLKLRSILVIQGDPLYDL